MSADFKSINVGALTVGSYILTLTATDSSGLAGTATITIIAAAAEGVVAPLINISVASPYTVHSAMGDRIPYTVTGTDPVVSMEVSSVSDVDCSGFKLDISEKMIVINQYVPAAEYNVTVIAKNSAGESRVTIIIVVVVG